MVPHFAGLLRMMSSGRAVNDCQRLLSHTVDRYRTSASLPTYADCQPGAHGARVAYGRTIRSTVSSADGEVGERAERLHEKCEQPWQLSTPDVLA